MAEKRMFTKKITESDAFLNMPLSTQALYFHLNMAADDEGFVNSPKKIQRMIGALDDDFKLLLAKNFVIAFESGVIVIKHWKMHNCIQRDRFHATDYQEERNKLEVKKNGAYTMPVYEMYTECIQNGNADKNRLDKNRLDKNRLDKNRLDKIRIDNTICGEPDKPTTPPEPVFIKIPLIDKSDFDVTESMVSEYKELYPAVDVEQALRSMRGWCMDNPTKKKTRNGVRRFIGSWMQREQNRGGYKKTETTDEWLARKEREQSDS